MSFLRVPEVSGQVQASVFKHTHSKSKAMHVQVSKPSSETHIPKAKSYENSEPPGVYREVREGTQLSLAYQTPDEGIRDQTYLSKPCSR